MSEIAYIFIFPGFIFLSIISLFGEYVDRKLYARFQNRIGPPWFQPFADFVKLIAKEEIIPESANPAIFRLAPIFALASTIAAFIYIPLWKPQGLMSFWGDIIVILYFLTIPTLSFFLGAWYSFSLYSKIGSVRALTQLFAYEVPLFMSILSPAILANTWSVKEIINFYNQNPLMMGLNVIAFGISLIALMGKLEKVPFDIPEAETEIVAGAFTEYGGKLYALIRLTLNIEAIAGCSLIAAIFFPFGLHLHPVIGFFIYLIKIFVLLFVLALFRTVFARIRIDQMVNLCWKYLAPLAIIQILLNLVVKGVFNR